LGPSPLSLPFLFSPSIFTLLFPLILFSLFLRTPYPLFCLSSFASRSSFFLINLDFLFFHRSRWIRHSFISHALSSRFLPVCLSVCLSLSLSLTRSLSLFSSLPSPLGYLSIFSFFLVLFDSLDIFFLFTYFVTQFFTFSLVETKHVEQNKEWTVSVGNFFPLPVVQPRFFNCKAGKGKSFLSLSEFTSSDLESSEYHSSTVFLYIRTSSRFCWLKMRRILRKVLIERTILATGTHIYGQPARRLDYTARKLT
jgi:hypothetical protein